MTPTRIIQLCQTKKCGRMARFFSKVKNAFVCDRCADPDALTGGFGPMAGRPEELTPIVAQVGDGWEAA